MRKIQIKVLNNEHELKVIAFLKDLGGLYTKIDLRDTINSYYTINQAGMICCTRIPYITYKTITLPEYASFPKRMLVRLSPQYSWQDRIVLGVFGTQAVAVDGSQERYYKINETYDAVVWPEYKELPKIEEMTYKQVCKALGRAIKITDYPYEEE